MCQNAGLPEAVNIPTRACARRNSHLCLFADILDPPRAHLGCIRVRALAEPMTARQFGQLATLALCNSVHIPFIEREDRNGQHVTKAEAGRLIIMFENGEQPSQEYLDSLGRGPPVSAFRSSFSRFPIFHFCPQKAMQNVDSNNGADK